MVKVGGILGVVAIGLLLHAIWWMLLRAYPEYLEGASLQFKTQEGTAMIKSGADLGLEEDARRVPGYGATGSFTGSPRLSGSVTRGSFTRGSFTRSSFTGSFTDSFTART